jgi:hypothetical protein
MGVHRLAALAAVAGLFGASLSGSQAPATPAGQVPPPPAGRGAPPAAIGPLVPVAAGTLALHPEAYVGAHVTVTAAVAQLLGDTAFTIDQRRAPGTAEDVLVLAPLLTAPLAPHAYVTVIGEAVRFDPAEAAAKMHGKMPVLSPEVAAAYRGRAAIIATSVITSALSDLARKLPPPMSPEETALDKLMKQIGPAFTALRQAAAAASAPDASQQAATLKTAFADTASFWKAKAVPDAGKWSDEARAESVGIEAAAGKGEWDAVKAAIPRLQQTCTNCHGAHRDHLDDGSYRFK